MVQSRSGRIRENAAKYASNLLIAFLLPSNTFPLVFYEKIIATVYNFVNIIPIRFRIFSIFTIPAYYNLGIITN